LDMDKGVGRKISRRDNGKKDKKLANKDRKIALLSLFQEGQREKRPEK